MFIDFIVIMCVYHYCFFNVFFSACYLSLSLSLPWLWLLYYYYCYSQDAWSMGIFTYMNGWFYQDRGPHIRHILGTTTVLACFFRDSWGFDVCEDSWPFLEGCKHDVLGWKWWVKLSLNLLGDMNLANPDSWGTLIAGTDTINTPSQSHHTWLTYRVFLLRQNHLNPPL